MVEVKPKPGRHYLMRNGESCGPLEKWNPILVIAPMTREGARYPDHPPHHTFDMAGCSTWQEQFDLVDELSPSGDPPHKSDSVMAELPLFTETALRDEADHELPMLAFYRGKRIEALTRDELIAAVKCLGMAYNAVLNERARLRRLEWLR